MNKTNEVFSLNYSEIDPLISRTTVWIAWKVAHIQLQEDRLTREPKHSCCAVYTTTKGAYQVQLVLCASRRTLRRIAQGMLEESSEDSEEIEEAAKEFFNILCGSIVSEIANRYRANVLFSPPCFAHDDCRPLLCGLSKCMSFADGEDVEISIICNWRSTGSRIPQNCGSPFNGNTQEMKGDNKHAEKSYGCG